MTCLPLQQLCGSHVSFASHGDPILFSFCWVKKPDGGRPMNENKNKIKKNKSDFAHLQQEQFVSCKSLEAFFPLVVLVPFDTK
jgi:hypothetical protein